MGLFDSFFKKPKSIHELETQKDIILYSLDFMLMHNVINVDEYNRLLLGVLPYVRGE